jgi:hypothetical protein
MRKIPVTANGDYNTIIGFLELNDNISDEQLRDMYVSWLWVPERKQIVSVSLVPMMSVPADERGRYDDLRCPNCNQPVMYGSQHTRDGMTPRDVIWVCDRRD